jgi:hypothetical protein
VPTGDVEPPDGYEEACEAQVSAALDEQDRRLREGTGDLQPIQGCCGMFYIKTLDLHFIL